jgi:hypothetical protein
LAGDTATFALALQGHGLGVLGTTPHDAVGLDFSTLDITATHSSSGGGGGTTVPEPPTGALMLAGLVLAVVKVLKR